VNLTEAAAYTSEVTVERRGEFDSDGVASFFVQVRRSDGRYFGKTVRLTAAQAASKLSLYCAAVGS
jgi:hypothetical protein